MDSKIIKIEEKEKGDRRFSYRLKKMADLVDKYGAGGIILDIGFALFPNQYLKGKVIGVDLFIPKYCDKNYQKLIKADVCKRLPFKDNSVEVVILGGVIEHLENPTRALKEIKRVLKQGGVLLIETPNPYFLPVILSDLFMNLRFYFKDTHINLFPRRIMLKLLWNNGFGLKDIVSCGLNLRESFTIPFPQHLAQDIIYVAIKKKPNNPYFRTVRNMRIVGYE